MDKNDLHDAAFGQWLKSRHLQKKHVFAGEEKRATDYSKHYNSVENTNQLNFDITQVNTVYNAQVGGYKQERDTIYYNSPTTFTHNSILTLQALPIKDTWENLNDNQKSAIISITYNYGRVPKRIRQAIKSGDPIVGANAIRKLATDNDGINKDRRLEEASMFEGATSSLMSRTGSK